MISYKIASGSIFVLDILARRDRIDEEIDFNCIQRRGVPSKELKKIT